MQFFLDTATDKPSELYKIGKFLVTTFEVGGAEPSEPQLANLPIPDHLLRGVPFKPSPDDVEVEIDSEGGISPMVAEVTLTAPPPPVPVAVPDPVPAAPGAVAEFDSKGYPWDARIHASNRAKKLDGSWKNKRGVDPNLVVAVEAQTKPAAPALVMSGAEAQAANFGRALRADSSPSAPASTESPVSVQPAPPPPPPPPPVPLQDSTGSAPVAPTVAAISTPTASTPTSAIDFRGLMIKIQQSKTAGKLTDEQVATAMGAIGLKLEDMAVLIGNTALIASVNSALDKCLSA
jgi:hypothetical protein